MANSAIDTDVLIIGAGPAGSAAAITLARNGVDVTMIDRSRFPRDKCCGDGLTTLALRLLDDLGLQPETITSWNDVDRIMLRAPSGRELSLQLPEGAGRFAAIAKRDDLDHSLVQLARSCNAAVFDGVGLVELSPGQNHVVAKTTTDIEFRARYIIAADGMWSPTRKALGMHSVGYRGDWHGFRQYMTADSPASRDLWVWFERDLLPGYAWSFPLPNGEVNVGFGVVRRGKDRAKGAFSGSALAALWRELLERSHIRQVLGRTETTGTHKAWPIPARLPDVCLVGPRTLFVGDAAAASDPMTGEGIGQALETGILAAVAITEGGSSRPAVVADYYRSSALRALRADHKVAASLSKVLRSPRATDLALGAVGISDWTRRNFARWMFEDYPRAIVATPRRWRSDMFAGNGAYFTDRRSSSSENPRSEPSQLSSLPAE